LSAASAGKKTTKTSRKNARNSKKFQLLNDDDNFEKIFNKISAYSKTFQVSNSKSWFSVSDFLMKS